MKIRVDDMMCEHCAKTIEARLAKAEIAAKVDLVCKTVEIADETVDKAVEIISGCGYHPTR